MVVLRNNGVSSVDMLDKVKQLIQKDYPILKKFLDKFIAATQVKLFDNLDSLLAEIKKPGEIDKFISGKYGQNELLTYMAQAHQEHSEDFSLALQNAVQSILKSNNLVTDENLKFLDQAFVFSNLRKFKFEVMEDFEQKFDFDFVAAIEKGTKIQKAELHKNVNIKFYYDQSDLKLFQNYNEWYGDSTFSDLGLFFNKINWARTIRKVSVVEICV